MRTPADLQTPVSAFLSIARDEPEAFLLESVEGGEKIGRYTFLGVRPYMVFSARGEEIEIRRGKKVERLKGELFPKLKEVFSQHRPAKVAGMPPFTSGAVGYFSYDVVRQLESIPKRAKDDLKLPDCVLMFFDRVLAFDHVRQQIQIIAAADVVANKPSRAYEIAVKDIEDIEKRLLAGLSKRDLRAESGKDRKLRVRSTTDREKFIASVKRVKEYIAAGDVFQTVLSQRLEMEPGVPPFDIYRALRGINPSPYMYFLRLGEKHVLGSSPEML